MTFIAHLSRVEEIFEMRNEKVKGGKEGGWEGGKVRGREGENEGGRE